MQLVLGSTEQKRLPGALAWALWELDLPVALESALWELDWVPWLLAPPCALWLLEREMH
jgi:hypothetical protein